MRIADQGNLECRQMNLFLRLHESLRNEAQRQRLVASQYRGERQPRRHFDGGGSRAHATGAAGWFGAKERPPCREWRTWLEGERAAHKGLLLLRVGPRRLDGQEFEPDLVAPVLLEDAGALNRHLEVVPYLGLLGEPGERRRQGRLDVGQHQLLCAVHGAKAALAQDAAVADAPDAPDSHNGTDGSRIVADVIERDLEVELELVQAWLEGKRHGIVGVDLEDPVEDLVVLGDAVSRHVVFVAALGLDDEGSPGLAL